MKLIEVVNSMNPLSVLYVCRGLDANIAYRIARNFKVINEEYEEFEKKKKELADKYAEKDKNGDFIIKKINEVETYSMTVENELLFREQIAKLLNEEVELKIKKVKLGDISKSGLSGEELILLNYMIEFDEDE